MDGHVNVHIRIKDAGNEGVWSYEDGSLAYIQGGKSRSFQCFNSVYLSKNTADFYSANIHSAISRFKDMKNATIIAYGQTGTGKTYTMSGENEDGLIYLALKDIMPGKFTISYIEIYNERVYDLKTAKELKIAMSGQNIHVIGLHIETISSESDAKRFLRDCSHNRKTNSTEYNLNSSRSHTIIQIKSENACLNFIDLAGSERMSLGHERRKEGAHINRSLLSLGKVVSDLAAKRQTVYRESKLTRILQPSVNPHTSIVAICTISASYNSLAESLGTIKFAARLCNIDLKFTETVLQEQNEKLGHSGGAVMGEEKDSAGCTADHTDTGSINMSDSMIGARPSDQVPPAFPEELSLWDFSPMKGVPNARDKNVLLSDGGHGAVDFYTDFFQEGTENHALLTIYEKRIESLENMIKELLEKSPNKLMSEIFILEKHMFVLRKQLIKKETCEDLE